MKCIGLMLCALNFFYHHKNNTFEVNKVPELRFRYIAI